VLFFFHYGLAYKNDGIRKTMQNKKKCSNKPFLEKSMGYHTCPIRM